ncbi:MAG: hypothetical protein DRI71_06780 [Bacteroidetes bacterium]|nr:MAG: hypothetical protein DRI71_06780 [Bacteroidota bacterium]
MSQYKTDGQTGTPTVDVTNGSATVLGNDSEFTANITVGDGFRVIGINVPYTVASKVDDVEFTISPVWAGSTDTDLPFTISRDFTTEYDLTELSKGDKEWVEIYTANLRIIDAQLKIAVGTTIGEMPDGGEWVLASPLQITGDDVVIGEAITPDRRLHVIDVGCPIMTERKGTGTTAMQSIIDIKRTTTGDMVDNFGTSLNFMIEDSSSVQNKIGELGYKREGADNSGKFTLVTVDAGSESDAIIVNPNGETNIPNSLIIGVVDSPSNLLQVKDSGVGADVDIEVITGSGGGTTGLLLSDTVVGRGRLYYDHGSNPEGIKIQTAGVDVAIFTTTGKVGIGTGSPATLFHIYEDSSAKAQITLENTDGYGTISTDINVLTYDAEQHIFNNRERTTEHMRIDNSGNVGIGTNDPAKLLHLQNDTSSSGPTMLVENLRNTGTVGIGFIKESTYYSNLRITGTGEFQYGANNAAFTSFQSRFEIDTDGNVSIGNPTTNYGKLHVKEGAGAISSAPSSNADTLVIEGDNDCGISIVCPDTDWANIFFGNTSDSLRAKIAFDSTNDEMVIGTSNGGMSLSFETAASVEAMRITSNQDVTIGGPGATCRLDVYDDPTTNGDAQWAIQSVDTSTFAEGVGGGIAFSGKYNSAQTITRFGAIWAEKAEATDGNYAGRLHFASRSEGQTLATAMVIDDLQNVGIGTDSPVGKFHVHSTSGGQEIHISNDGATSSDRNSIWFVTDKDGTPTYSAIGMRHDNPGLMLTGNDNLFAAPDMFIKSNGNVGIGTISPAGNLHVKSGAGAISATPSANADELVIEGASAVGMTIISNDATTAAINFGSTTDSTEAFIILDNGDEEFNIGTWGNNELVLKTGATEAMRIDSSQNVGIGTDSPESKLMVETGAEGTIATFRGDNANQLKIGTTDATDVSYIMASNCSLSLQVNAVEAMRIDTSLNVGIGTDSPLSNLHIAKLNGPPVLTIDRIDSSLSTGQVIASINFRGGEVTPQTVASIDAICHSSWSESASHTALAFSTTSAMVTTEAMRINRYGNVGIGTDDPDVNLHVHDIGNANIYISTDSSTHNAALYFKNDYDGSNYTAVVGQDGDIPGLRLGASTLGDPDMMIFPNGGVGIGTDTSTPNQKLHLHAAGSGSVYFRVSNSTTGLSSGIRIGLDGSENGQIVNDYNSDLYLQTNNDAKLILASNDNHICYGNWELNRDGATSGLTRSLTISGAQTGVGTDFAQINFQNYDAGNYTVARISSQNPTGTDSGDLRFYTGESGSLTSAICIDENQLVAIGGNNPAYKLDVDGEIAITERSSNPNSPTEGKTVIWMSDGTGHGDDGDVMIASTAGGVTRYSTLFDHSAGTTF